MHEAQRFSSIEPANVNTSLHLTAHSGKLTTTWTTKVSSHTLLRTQTTHQHLVCFKAGMIISVHTLDPTKVTEASLFSR